MGGMVRKLSLRKTIHRWLARLANRARFLTWIDAGWHAKKSPLSAGFLPTHTPFG
jgi:hypothetical protein